MEGVKGLLLSGGESRKAREKSEKLGLSLAVRCFILCRFDWAVPVIYIYCMYVCTCACTYVGALDNMAFQTYWMSIHTIDLEKKAKQHDGCLFGVSLLNL